MKKLIIIICCLFSLPVVAQTYINGGNIGGEWYKSASPYIITADINLPADSSLIINAGVEVLFEESVQMHIHGSFKANGTESDSVLFSAYETSHKWLGMIISYVPAEKDSIILEYCKFTGAAGMDTSTISLAFGALYLNNVNKIRISRSTFEGNTGYHGSAITAYDSPVVISHCDIVSQKGTGIYLYHADAYIYQCRIQDNVRFENKRGGGITGILSNPRIISNRIINNSSTTGGGINLNAALDLEIRDNDISENKTVDGLMGGGGIFLTSSNGLIVNNRITNNVCPVGGWIFHSYGGGIYTTDQCDLKIVNNLISGNVAYYGAAFHANHSKIELVNNTIVKNGHEDSYRGGIYLDWHCNLEAYNNIIYDNLPAYKQLFFDENTEYLAIYNSCIEGIYDTLPGMVIENIFGEEPVFNNPAAGDFSLRNSSPCINKGFADTTGLHLPDVDLNGNPRIHNRIVDIGAYENQMLNTGPLTLNDSLHFQMQEDFGVFELYLDTVFDDDATVKYLSYELIDPHTSNCFEVNFSEGYLQLSSKEDVSGLDTLHILAKDDFNLATDAILFFETMAVDDPPEVVNPLADLRLKMNSADTLLNVADVFTDVDNPDEQITLSLEHYNQALLSAELQSDQILLQIQPGMTGIDTLILQATSNSLSNSDTFLVEVYDASAIIEILNPVVKACPNPASDYIDVYFEKGVEQIHMYNLKGKLLQTFSPGRNEEEIKISLKEVSEGVYLLRFIYSEGRVALKFVKN